MDTLTGVSPNIPKPASTAAISGRHCIGTPCNSHITELHVQLFKSNRPVLDAVARSVTKDPQRRFKKNASVVPSRSRPEARAEETAGTFAISQGSLLAGKYRSSGSPQISLERCSAPGLHLESTSAVRGSWQTTTGERGSPGSAFPARQPLTL